MSQYSRLDGETTTSSSPPPQYESNDHHTDHDDITERDHLVEAFEDSSDEEEGNVLDDDWEDDRNRPATGGGASGGGSNGRSLNPFSRAPTHQQYHQISDGEVLYDSNNGPSSSLSASTSSSPPPPLTTSSGTSTGPSPSFARSFFSNWRFNRSRSGPSGSSDNNNDGVFANITAKPDNSNREKPNGSDDDTPPTYEEAAADATPPYWETTILTPGYGDELFIEGLPVGSPINFIWNMMVSSAFQFVGFFLTYLLHTSHAAKQGSRAGLGFTLVQCGYYLSPQGVVSNPTAPPNEFEPSDPNNPDVESSNGISGKYTGGHASASSSSAAASNDQAASSPAAEHGWISTALFVIGILIFLKSLFDYFQARRMEYAILASNGNEGENENASGGSQSGANGATNSSGGNDAAEVPVINLSTVERMV